jgi:hypothetical protein
VDLNHMEKMDVKVKDLRRAAEELLEMGGAIEAVRRNCDRLLASVRMLELNVSDAREVL